ncbi:alpha/beta fold hydrolase [Castellaniella sp.]|uniref:alpha/beta fold hydrolase n=1 Tax=Castellaniella sp. TaxID=1955812 RepID=UPI0035614425
MLIHGAWHGAWCWDAVAESLRHAGHNVHTPTLPGLGERSHESLADIGLSTFIDDICRYIDQHDLHTILLVGHSFGGLVATGVADRLPQRIGHLILLDPFLLPSGQSAFDTLSPEVVAKLEHGAAQVGGLPPPQAARLGLPNPDDQAYVQARLVPHPIGTYREPLQLRNPPGHGLPVTHIRCTDPVFGPVDGAWSWAREQFGNRWQWRELAAGHDAMISHPQQVAGILLDIAASAPGAGGLMDQSAR